MRFPSWLVPVMMAGLVAGCGLTPVHHIGTAARSSSGGHVAANGLLAFSAGGAGTNPAVYTARPDGSDLRRLPLPAGLGLSAVAWSPDGDRIAFAADDLARHEDSNLYVVAANGRGVRQLTRGLYGVSDISWSPGGGRLAFAGWTHGTPAVFIIGANGTGLRRVLKKFAVHSLSWGPGGRLAIAGTPVPASGKWRSSYGIWTVNVNGSRPRLVAGPVRLPHVLGSRVIVRAWFADGRHLLVQNAPRHGDISEIPVNGGRTRIILRCPLRTCSVVAGTGMGAPPTYRQYVGGLALSPDGRTIVFSIGASARSSLYDASVASAKISRLRIADAPPDIVGLSWQPLTPGTRSG